MRILRVLLALLAVADLAACADPAQPSRSPAAVEIVDGDGQEALSNGTLPDSLRVRVTDRDGMPLPGVLVAWTASSGAISTTSNVTDASGMAAARWAFYSTATGASPVGTHHAAATVTGAGSATFTGHARAGVVLRGITIAPDRVNVASSAAPVTVTVHATDDRTGLGLTYVSVQFYNPTATSTVFESWLKPLDLTGGTPADGVWQGTITVPQGAETGAWKLGRVTLSWGCGFSSRIELFDSHLRSLGLPYQLTVTTEPSQSQVPSAQQAGEPTPLPASSLASPGEPLRSC